MTMTTPNSEPHNQKTVEIVDDAVFMRNILKRIFKENNFKIVAEAETADAGVQAYKEFRPSLITMDIMMPNKSGLEAIKEIMAFDKDAKILVISSLGQELLIMDAIELGARDFIVKPFKKEKLMAVVTKILKNVILYFRPFYNTQQSS